MDPSLQPIVSPTVGIFSIAAWATSAILALILGTTVLFKRAFPPVARFISDDSSLKFMATRSRLLLAVVVLVAIDAASNSYHNYTAFALGKYNPLAHRAASAFTFSAGLVVTILAISFRCAVVVVADDAWRKKFLRASKFTCFLVWACHAAGAFQTAFEVKDLPPRVQYNERMYALWSTVIICFLPLLAFAGSIQSIRVAVRTVHEKQLERQQQQSAMSGAGSRLSQHVAKSISRTAASLQKTATVTSPKRPARPVSISSSGETGNPYLSPISSPNNSKRASVGDAGGLAGGAVTSRHPAAPVGSPGGLFADTPSATIGRGGLAADLSATGITSCDQLQSRQVASPQTSRSTAGRVSYPLSRTFAWLNVLVVCVWTLACLVTASSQIGPFRNNSLLSLLLTLCVGVESSFERLMQYHNRKRARRKQQQADRREAEQVGTNFVDPAVSVLAENENENDNETGLGMGAEKG